jgi:hypothetical protein
LRLTACQLYEVELERQVDSCSCAFRSRRRRRKAREPYARTLEKIQAALEKAGVEFIPENGGGVELG